MILLLFSLGVQTANRKSRNCAPVTFVGTSFMFGGPGEGRYISLWREGLPSSNCVPQAVHQHPQAHIHTHIPINEQCTRFKAKLGKGREVEQARGRARGSPTLGSMAVHG